MVIHIRNLIVRYPNVKACGKRYFELALALSPGEMTTESRRLDEKKEFRLNGL
jgi:hypothetical protein